ncbi:hypothetical protein B0I18_111103 [Taibaiella chishuiensis]|uniref:Uncharacterized protein n=2 Tax=Taibaiella chishuiensis TaxID=1434707 RepID=A0A2P8CX96_9BACT|nr:hypothetical protein B0I18_111103 [Taibaiella chishuiensis]
MSLLCYPFFWWSSVLAQDIRDSAEYNDAEVRLSFYYKYQGAGAGGGMNVNVIPFDLERKAMTDILFSVLQENQYSVLNYDPNGKNALLEMGRWYFTDTVAMDREKLKAYNESNKTMSMPADRYYALQYKVLYQKDILDGTKRMNITTVTTLFQRGAAGPWSLFKGQYSGAYFSNLLLNDIKAKLDKLYPKKK